MKHRGYRYQLFQQLFQRNQPIDFKLIRQARSVMERLERRHEPIKTVSTRRLSLNILKNIDETQEAGEWATWRTWAKLPMIHDAFLALL